MNIFVTYDWTVYSYLTWLAVIFWIMAWPDKRGTSFCYWEHDAKSDKWRYIAKCRDVNGVETVYINGIKV